MFQEEEEKELAVIFLQQVIRGRAIQNMVSIYRSLICTSIFMNCNLRKSLSLFLSHEILQEILILVKILNIKSASLTQYLIFFSLFNLSDFRRKREKTRTHQGAKEHTCSARSRATNEATGKASNTSFATPAQAA